MFNHIKLLFTVEFLMLTMTAVVLGVLSDRPWLFAIVLTYFCTSVHILCTGTHPKHYLDGIEGICMIVFCVGIRILASLVNIYVMGTGMYIL